MQKNNTRRYLRKVVLALFVFFLSLFPVVPCYGESLKVIEKFTLSADKATYTGEDHRRLYVSGAYFDNDIALVSSGAGLLARFPGDRSWEKVVELEPRGNNWWEDYEAARKKNALFSPQSIWRIAGTEELVVFDGRMGFLYTLEIEGRDSVSARVREKPDRESFVNGVCINNDLIIYGISTGYDNSALAVSHTDLSDYRRVFDCPPGLREILDSLAMGADPDFHPAYNPIDGDIWLAPAYYNRIYIVDMNGQLLDSVSITASDFRLPKPPVSRVKSQAVFQDWNSKCTPVRSFWYVAPGYFILQFRSGYEKMEPDSVALYSTLAWSADRRTVELAVDKRWWVVGVQPDGRIIFAHYVVEDYKAREITLTVARIEG